MGKTNDLRGNHVAGTLRRLAMLSREAVQTQRPLALASIYDGGSRSHAAHFGGITPEAIPQALG